MRQLKKVEDQGDLELIARFKAGDQTGLEELISRYTAKAFSLAHRLTKNPQDAEEVLQDVFTTVYRKIDGFEGKSSFSSWLYRITVNTSLMKLRKRRQNRAVLAEDVLPEYERAVLAKSITGNEGEAFTQRSQIGAVIDQAISKLPDDYRPVYILRDVDGLSSVEVSKILELSIPAIKSRLHRARLMLRRRLVPFYREFSGTNVRRAVGD